MLTVERLTIWDLCGDTVLYRNLEPLDPGLPGLQALCAQAGLPACSIPRKRELAYGRVLLGVIHAALARRGQALRALVVLGDTDGDRAMAASLRMLCGCPVVDAVAADRRDAPPAVVWEGDAAMLTRWALLDAVVAEAMVRGAGPQPGTVLVVDIDKTLLGARGRDDGVIDEARRLATLAVAGRLPAGAIDLPRVRQVHAELCRAAYFPLTQDNQDLTVYATLLVCAGVTSTDALSAGITDGSLGSFDALLAQVTSLVPPALHTLHAEIAAAYHAGDPTPFKAFRRAELRETLAAMANGTLTLCAEVAAVARRYRDAGALVLAASDKPLEAAVPGPHDPDLLPLHRMPALVRSL